MPPFLSNDCIIPVCQCCVCDERWVVMFWAVSTWPIWIGLSNMWLVHVTLSHHDWSQVSPPTHPSIQIYVNPPAYLKQQQQDLIGLKHLMVYFVSWHFHQHATIPSTKMVILFHQHICFHHNICWLLWKQNFILVGHLLVCLLLFVYYCLFIIVCLYRYIKQLSCLSSKHIHLNY